MEIAAPSQRSSQLRLSGETAGLLGDSSYRVVAKGHLLGFFCASDCSTGSMMCIGDAYLGIALSCQMALGRWDDFNPFCPAGL